MEILEKLKTITLKDDQTTTSISFPIEIIQDILSRLPIKPLLQFKSVSKHWLSLISNDPSFCRLHLTRSLATNRTALLISAFDFATDERHFLLASTDGGPLTYLLTLHNPFSDYSVPAVRAQHLNGLVLFTSLDLYRECNLALVINPATRNVFKLPQPGPDSGFDRCSYLFGFHQSRNEHYVLYIGMTIPETPNLQCVEPIEFMIYSLSTYSWRKIDVKEDEFPFDITGGQWYYSSIPSVCVNSVIHLILQIYNKILAFDLTTEKFSTIDIPRGAIPRDEMSTPWFDSDVKPNHPSLMDINGCLGIVCQDREVERNEMYFWILQDYDSRRGWVKETVTFSESWIDLNGLSPDEYVVDMDKIVFPVRRLSSDGVTVPIYDMKTKGFKLVQFTLDQQFLRSNTVKFDQVGSYVESILPLEKYEEGLHEDDK